MARGMSIHVGVNILDTNHYKGGTFPALESCVNDALDMRDIAKTNFTTPVPIKNKPNLVLADEDATTKNVIEILTEVAKGNDRLRKGDTLLLTFSGHGGKLAAIHEMESDGHNETWCFFDRQLLDDEIYALLSEFEEGVRILVICDSCNSGTATASIEVGGTVFTKITLSSRNFVFSDLGGKILKINKFNRTNFKEAIFEIDKKVFKEMTFASPGGKANLPVKRLKTLPLNILFATNDDAGNKDKYERIQKDILKTLNIRLPVEKKNDIRELIRASVILISACQDWQLTPDGDKNQNSKFTGIFKDVFAKKDFKNYLEFHQRLWDFFDLNGTGLSDIQNPSYYKIGPPNPSFELEFPFTV